VVTLQEVPRSLEQVYLKAMAEAQLPVDAQSLAIPVTLH